MSKELSDLNTCKNQGHLRTSYFKRLSSVQSSIMGRGVKKNATSITYVCVRQKRVI